MFSTLFILLVEKGDDTLLIQYIDLVNESALKNGDLEDYKNFLSKDEAITAVTVHKLDHRSNSNTTVISGNVFVKYFTIKGQLYQSIITTKNSPTFKSTLYPVGVLTFMIMFFVARLTLNRMIDPINNEMLMISGALQSAHCVHSSTEVRPKSNIREIGVLQKAVSRVVKELQVQRSNWNNIAFNDKLTNVYNRGFLENWLNEFELRPVSEFRPVSVIFIDLDKFKSLNDTYGHAFGDDALVKFTQVLKNNLRDGDIPIRFGGDEFVIIIEDSIDELRLSQFKESLTERLNNPVVLSGISIELSASVGYATFPNDVSDIRKLIGEADKNMYRDKERGSSQTDNITQLKKIKSISA